MKKIVFFWFLINVLIWLIISFFGDDKLAFNVGYNYYLIGYSILALVFLFTSATILFGYYFLRKRNNNL